MRIARKEEQRTQTNLLDVHPNEHMLESSREVQPSGVVRRRLFHLVKEAVFVQLVKEEEGCECKSVDDWGDDHVRNTYSDDIKSQSEPELQGETTRK